jgi:lipopolysaccharide transport system permease protein
MLLILLRTLVVSFMRKLVQHRSLIKRMVLRDLKSRYVGSAMGIFWSVLHPLVLLTSYTFVFSVILKQRPGPETGTSSFALYLFCSILPWLVFQETVMRSSNIIVDHASLITKTLFPPEILPISVLIANLINHLIGLGIFLGIVLLYLQKASVLFFLAPIYLFALLLFSLGLSWFISSVQVFLRDTAQVLSVVLTFWFWFTPIFFDEKRIPQRLTFLLRINPVAEVVSGYRKCFLSFEMPSVPGLIVLYAVALLTVFAGGLFFRYTKRSFADVL